MNGALAKMFNIETTPEAYSIDVIQSNLGLAVILGLLLAFSTYYTNLYTLFGEDRISPKNKVKLLFGASNILFLCIGLAGVMILVNNNLARAFSIGASLALVRFRVKMGQKNPGSNLLFGVLAGVACGLNEKTVAVYMVVIYIILQLALLLIARFLTRNEPKHQGPAIS